MYKVVIFILTLVVFISSCEKVETYSDIPEIKLDNFEVKSEKTQLDTWQLYGKLTFSFVDGDGDIGFLENSDSISDNNISDVIIKEYHKDGSNFIEKTIGPYHLPYFEKGLYHKSIKGEVLINIISHSSDTVYYEIFIIDREYHQSNTITTPTYIYSELSEQ